MFLTAALPFANALGNGFALDDSWFLVENEVVTEGRYLEAFTDASWPGALEGTGNYRPVALTSFAFEWSLWGDDPFGYHVVSVAAHVVASVLVLLLLSSFVGTVPALVGGMFFAIHPVHTEAVANIMGRSELYAAIAFLLACLLYLAHGTAAPSEGAGPTESSIGRGGERGLRLVGLVALFLVACGSKEIAVTLPAIVMAIEFFRQGDEPLVARFRREAVTYVALFAALGCFVIVRWNALGDITGESAAAGLLSLSTGERILTALTVWPHYLRLLAFPLDLSADYSPAVLLMTRQLDADVVFGALLIVGLLAAAWRFRTSDPALALGCAWFFIAISPVSNLFVRSDILLAERTLYLPSVGAALVVAGLTVRARGLVDERRRRGALAFAVVAGILLAARTWTRNPTWADTFTVLVTLNEDHPESWMSQRTQAISLHGQGDLTGAAAAYERALEIAPDHYQLLVDAAAFYHDTGDTRRSEDLLARAVALLPGHPEAYRRLAEQRLLSDDGRGAHAAALHGIARVDSQRDLWALVSESYIMKGDLQAAARARRAAISARPSEAGWLRLAEIFDAVGQTEEAADARTEAERLRSAKVGAGTS